MSEKTFAGLTILVLLIILSIGIFVGYRWKAYNDSQLEVSFKWDNPAPTTTLTPIWPVDGIRKE